MPGMGPLMLRREGERELQVGRDERERDYSSLSICLLPLLQLFPLVFRERGLLHEGGVLANTQVAVAAAVAEAGAEDEAAEDQNSAPRDGDGKDQDEGEGWEGGREGVRERGEREVKTRE